MRPDLSLLASLLVTSVAAGVIDAPDRRVDISDIIEPEPRDAELNDLWKRRGGGGGGGGGRPPSGGSGGSRPPGGSSGNRPTSGSTSNRPTTNTYSNSNAGGFSNGGSGPQPRFVGGQYYGGGAKVPFAAGQPSGGITPYRTSNVGFWPGPWLPFPVYMYPYAGTHHYRNNTSNEDEERAVLCACQEYNVCSCEEIEDDDDFEDMFEELLEDGDYNKMNHTLVTVGEVNGTKTIMINGTLPNGTTINSDNPDDYEEFLDSAAIKLGKTMGIMPLAVAVAAAVLMA